MQLQVQERTVANGSANCRHIQTWHFHARGEAGPRVGRAGFPLDIDEDHAHDDVPGRFSRMRWGSRSSSRAIPTSS